MLDFENLAIKNKGEQPFITLRPFTQTLLELERWIWDETGQKAWKKASSVIQDFYKRWRDSGSTELGHEVYIGELLEIPRIPEQFIVREAYKMLFDHTWRRAFRRPRSGVVVTGQPGIGE